MKKIVAAVLLAVGSIAALAAPAQAATYYVVVGEKCGRDQDPDPDVEVYYDEWYQAGSLSEAERVYARYDKKCQFARIDTITTTP